MRDPKHHVIANNALALDAAVRKSVARRVDYKIAGVKGLHPFETGNIPGCTYCHPQVASVGLTEKAAIAKGHEVKVGRFPFMGNGKAIESANRAADLGRGERRRSQSRDEQGTENRPGKPGERHDV